MLFYVEYKTPFCWVVWATCQSQGTGTVTLEALRKLGGYWRLLAVTPEGAEEIIA